MAKNDFQYGGWNSYTLHGRTDQLLSPIQIIVRMPEPDCFLRYRMNCKAEFYYVGKISRRGTGHGYRYLPPVAAATRFLRRRNTVVGSKCALPSALLVCCLFVRLFVCLSAELLQK